MSADITSIIWDLQEVEKEIDNLENEVDSLYDELEKYKHGTEKQLEDQMKWDYYIEAYENFTDMSYVKFTNKMDEFIKSVKE